MLNPHSAEVPVDRVLRIGADPADMLKNAGNEGAKRSYDDADLADSRSCEASSGPFTNGQLMYTLNNMIVKCSISLSALSVTPSVI